MTTTPFRRGGRLGRDRRGLTTLEFAFVALPLCLLLFAVVEIGLAVQMKSALQYATSQAARCAAVNTTSCSTTAQIQAYALANSAGVPQITTSTFTVSTAACGKQVSASLALPIITHLVIQSGVTLTAKSCYPV